VVEILPTFWLATGGTSIPGRVSMEFRRHGILYVFCTSASYVFCAGILYNLKHSRISRNFLSHKLDKISRNSVFFHVQNYEWYLQIDKLKGSCCPETPSPRLFYPILPGFADMRSSLSKDDINVWTSSNVFILPESMWPMWPSSLFFDARKSCSFFFFLLVQVQGVWGVHSRKRAHTEHDCRPHVPLYLVRDLQEREWAMLSKVVFVGHKNCFRNPMSLHKSAKKRRNTPYLIFHSLCESHYVAIIFSPLILKLVKNHIYTVESWNYCIP
jgi:hypothetical protein